MSKRAGPISTVAKLAFAAPFLAVGLVGFGAGLIDVILGNFGSWPAFPFGVMFFGAGALIVRSALREGRSREAVVAEQTKQGDAGESDLVPLSMVRPVKNYRSAAGTARSALHVYGPALASLPVQKFEPRAGQVLNHAVSLHSPQSSFAEIFFALVWNGFVWPFLFVMVEAGSVLGSLFLLVFCAVGAYLLVTTARKILGRRRLPRVEVSAEPAYLGDELRIHVDQMGPARITHYAVRVRCEEIVNYTVGTKTRAERHEVVDFPLYDQPGGPRLALGERWTHDLSLVLPAEAPASFESANNQLLWSVRIRAEIAGWPDYDEAFAFRALPRPVS